MKLRIVFYFMLLLLQSALAHAEGEDRIYIKVGDAAIKRSLLAFPPLIHIGADSPAKYTGSVREVYETALNDLDVSNYFTFIKAAAYLEDPMKVGLRPAPGEGNGFNFEKWKSIGTEFLIRAGYKVVGNEFQMEGYVYHVPRGELVFGKSYKAPLSSVRALAHTFTNDVVKSLTGKPGMFLTKIVTSSNRGVRPSKEIFVMDWDGANVQQISFHKSIALSPAWGPDAKKVAYSAFTFNTKDKTRNANLFLFDLTTKSRWLVSFEKGTNSGANFLHNGKELLMTITKEGKPDIYRMPIDGIGKKALTNGPFGAMNVEPAISPDGKRIAFSSDRSGSPMIYVMNADGSEPKRLTFAGRYNSSPAWSPDGTKLAFAGYDKTHFDIFIMNTDGTGLERLTSAKKTNGKNSDNEEPTFSPDGRHIMFSSNRSGSYQLYIVSPDGQNERRITQDKYDYTKPRWSNFLN